MHNNLNIKNMNKELIDEIRNVLNFMEEFDALVSKAQETDDTEWENDLFAGECSARHRLRELVNQLLGDVLEESENLDGEPF